jgi:hypothetical protein
VTATPAMTTFGEILRRAVLATPGAVGGAFADSQGEMVDAFSETYSAHDWAVLTAHYGVILAHIHAAFGIWHFGGPEYIIAQHEHLGIAIYVVGGGYYALLATSPAEHAGEAVPRLREATIALKREML